MEQFIGRKYEKELLKQYIESHNGQFPLHQEPKIGSWLSNQKQAYKKKYGETMYLIM